MKHPRSSSLRPHTACRLLLLTAALAQIGCSTDIRTLATATATSGASSTVVSSLSGQVQAGHQPMAAATIYLYAAGGTGYASASTNLLTATVLSDSSGNFNLAYSCTAGQQLYVLARGGNAGAGANASAALMAGVGDCASLTSSSFVTVNEVTTVASVFALAPFMTAYADLGAPASNLQGMARAFASVNKLANTATGTAPGSALPNGATAPTAQLNTLANILAACVASTGGRAGDGSICGRLFTLTTPAAGTPPTDTVAAALAIAHNPTLNAAALYALASTPFTPALTAAPTDWALSITYHPSGLDTPSSTTVDAGGNIWVANAGNNTLTVLAQTGVPIAGSPFSGNGLSTPTAIALDASGNAWVANSGASTLSIFQNNGSVWSGSPIAVGGSPVAIAIDPTGDIWVANSAGNSLSQLSSSGALLETITSNLSSPSAIAINTH
jgi:hypothetical protein